MSDEGFKFQTSIKYGPGGTGMLNIRANTKEEFEENLRAALATLGDNAVLMEAYNLEFQSVGGAAPAASAPAPGRSSGELCAHGAMTFHTGSKAGKAWSGWFCPLPKGTPGQCPPKFDK